MLKKKVRGNYDLRSSPFFRLRTRKGLANLLRITIETLDTLSRKSNFYEPDEISCELYVRVWKHKAEKNSWLKFPPDSGQSTDYRPIDIPNIELKKIQSRIAEILSRVAPTEWLFSPVKGRSYVDNAVRHRGAKAYWMMDVADYFPSCTANKIAWFFGRKLECSPDVTAILVNLSTLDKKLPQGSPCSPILAYFANFDVWAAISEVVKTAQLTHSVYADDLTISGAMVPKSVIWEIKKIFHRHGLKLKRSKELSLINQPADITGVIIAGNSVRLPNRQFKKLHDLLGQRVLITDPKMLQRIDGKISGRLAQKRQVEQVE